MHVKIISRRLFRISQKDQIVPLLKQLRESAQQQPGFISRTTYSSLNDPGECIVISDWKSADDWIEWMNRKEVQEFQWKIDSLIGEKTFFNVHLLSRNDLETMKASDREVIKARSQFFLPFDTE